MNLITERYNDQQARWPSWGRHILVRFDDGSVVYQAYRPEIGHFAAHHSDCSVGVGFDRMRGIIPTHGRAGPRPRR